MQSRKRATPRILVVGLLAPGAIVFLVGMGVLIGQFVSGEPDDSPAAQPQPPAPAASAPQQSAFAAGSQQLTCAAGAQHALTTPAASLPAESRSTPITHSFHRQRSMHRSSSIHRQLSMH